MPKVPDRNRYSWRRWYSSDTCVLRYRSTEEWGPSSDRLQPEGWLAETRSQTMQSVQGSCMPCCGVFTSGLKQCSAASPTPAGKSGRGWSFHNSLNPSLHWLCTESAEEAKHTILMQPGRGMANSTWNCWKSQWERRMEDHQFQVTVHCWRLHRVEGLHSISFWIHRLHIFWMADKHTVTQCYSFLLAAMAAALPETLTWSKFKHFSPHVVWRIVF